MRWVVRRVLLWVLNPRPRWWESMWLVGVVAAVVFWRFRVVALETGTGSWRLSAVVGLKSDGTIVSGFESLQNWDVQIAVRQAYGAGWERIEVLPVFRAIPPAVGAPSPQVQEAMSKWIATDSETFGSENTLDPPLQTARRLLATGDSVAEWRAWWRPLFLVIEWGSLAFVLVAPGVGFLRGAQRAWWQRQLERLSRDECPGCGYNMQNLFAVVCPECGTNVYGAAREAREMLGPHGYEEV